MKSKKVTRHITHSTMNIDDSCEENIGEPMFLYNLYVEPIDLLQIKRQQERQPEIESEIEIKTPQTLFFDTDQYISSMELQKNQSCPLNELLNKAIKGGKQIDYSRLNYFLGHISYLKTLNFPIFGQNTRYDRTKRRGKALYFTEIAKAMNKFKRGKPDTNYAKRFDQQLQKTLRLMAQTEKTGGNLTFKVLKRLNEALGNEDNNILTSFQNKYNSKRRFAILLKKIVNSDDSLEKISLEK